METYKFETTVQENGVIQIPEIANLAHQQVEIFVVVRTHTQPEPNNQLALEKFIRKWRGILKDGDPDILKSQYLQEKYE